MTEGRPPAARRRSSICTARCSCVGAPDRAIGATEKIWAPSSNIRAGAAINWHPDLGAEPTRPGDLWIWAPQVERARWNRRAWHPDLPSVGERPSRLGDPNCRSRGLARLPRECAIVNSMSTDLPIGLLDSRLAIKQSERRMTHPSRTVQSLPIGWGPRLRISGLPEFLSFIGVLTLGFSVVDALRGEPPNWGGPAGAIAVGVIWCWSVSVRIAMGVAYIEANENGIRWRTFFRVTEVSWSRVDAVAVGTMLLLPNNPTELRTPVLVVTTSDGGATKVRASAWCNRQSLERWAHDATSA